MLTYVAYNSIEDRHFAEFLVIAYPKTQENAYKNFIENISSKLANGSRPDITLDKFERNKIESNKGDYKIDKFLKKPELEKGCAIVKNKQGIMEKIIEAGRQKKIGCYIGSTIFLLIVVLLIVLFILNLF